MRRSLLAIESAFAIALLAAVAKQHWAENGVEVGVLALAVLSVPAHTRRLLAVLGRMPVPSPVFPILEAVTLLGAFVYPVPTWIAGIALAATLNPLWRTDDVSKAPLKSLEILALLAVLAAGGSVVYEILPGRAWPLLRVVGYAIVLLEAISPWRPRTDEDSLRRLSAAAALVGTSGLFSRMWERPALARVTASALTAALAFVYLTSARQEISARERRKLLMRIVAPTVVFSLVILLGEIGFRIVPNRYRELVPYEGGFWHIPGKTYVYEGALLSPRQPFTNVVLWNKEGWHDADHEHVKPKGVGRVIVLGDSYVEGVQVPLDALYHRKLERALAARSACPVEAIGLGSAGWGQIQELECLREHGLHYDPDLAILEFLPGNDVRNNDEELEKIASEEQLHLTRARELFIHSVNARLFLFSFLCDKVDHAVRRSIGRLDGIDTDVYRVKPRLRPDRWESAWKHTEELITEIKSLLAPRGVTLVVVVFTSLMEIDACDPNWPPAPNEMDMRIPARRMAEICRRLGLPCLDLAERFAKHPVEVRHAFHLENDGHWSATGHAEGAKQTATFLLDETGCWKTALEHSAR